MRVASSVIRCEAPQRPRHPCLLPEADARGYRANYGIRVPRGGSRRPSTLPWGPRRYLVNYGVRVPCALQENHWWPSGLIMGMRESSAGFTRVRNGPSAWRGVWHRHAVSGLNFFFWIMPPLVKDRARPAGGHHNPLINIYWGRTNNSFLWSAAAYSDRLIPSYGGEDVVAVAAKGEAVRTSLFVDLVKKKVRRQNRIQLLTWFSSVLQVDDFSFTKRLIG